MTADSFSDPAPHSPRGGTVRVGRSLLVMALAAAFSTGDPHEALAGEEPPSEAGFFTRSHLIPDPIGLRTWLEEQDIQLSIAYTGDFLANTVGGLARKNDYVGNLDITLTWDTEALLGRDLGTFFVYGLYDHGGRPSASVGDTQGVDNIETNDSAKIFEAWWQKSLFADRASILVGLYDMNSEFYAVESAEMFIHSSFGLGGELGNTGPNGPSTFPAASLGVRFKAEPIDGFEIQAAILDGVPGDPRRPKGTRIRFGSDDGAFVIAEVAYHRSRMPTADDVSRTTQRRRIGRELSERPKFLRIALGTWLYTAQMPHLSRTDPAGNPIKSRGHPGLYLIADYDASQFDPFSSRGLSVFIQLGLADGDVGQFAGYMGGGFKYAGLLPFRPDDEFGFGVAAAYNGHAFRRASRAAGNAPALAETAFEWTYRAALTPWLSIQGDIQYIMNPGGLRDRPDALVAGIRYVVDL